LKSPRSTIILLVIAALTLIADQVTKFQAMTRLAPVVIWAPIPSLAHIFTFTYTTNTGASFGLFKDWGPVLMVISVVVITAIIIYQKDIPEEAWLVRLALGLMLGGSTGNLVDRLRVGHVIDFMHLHYYSPRLNLDWPVFNVADMSIVTGVILFAFTMLREGKAPAKPVPQPSESTESNPPASA
jgi:signal peptidase II